MHGGGESRSAISVVHQLTLRSTAKDGKRNYQLRVSYLEIYNETLNDLLAPLSLAKARLATAVPMTKSGRPCISEAKDRVRVHGLREIHVTSPAEVLELLEAGQALRRTAATDWNERSSRSHCVLTVTIESHGSGTPGDDPRFSQLNLIDLAGSERASANVDRRKEGAFVSQEAICDCASRHSHSLLASDTQINKSLLTLGTVIAKLSEAAKSDDSQQQHQHIPYRDSKLTRLLQDSLSGNAQVAVLCTMDAGKKHGVESLNTLKFGRRCKPIQTRARRGIVRPARERAPVVVPEEQVAKGDPAEVIASLQNQLGTALAANEELSAVNQDLTAANQNQEVEISAFQGDLADAEEALHSAIFESSAYASGLEDEVSELKEETAKLEKEKSELKEENSKLMEKNSELKGKVFELKDRVQSLEAAARNDDSEQSFLTNVAESSSDNSDDDEDFEITDVRNAPLPNDNESSGSDRVLRTRLGRNRVAS